MTFSVLFKAFLIKTIMPFGKEVWYRLYCNIPITHASLWETRQRNPLRTAGGTFSCFRLTANKVQFWMFGSSKL